MIDLRHNYPLHEGQPEMLQRYLRRAADEFGREQLTLPPWGGADAELGVAARWLRAAPEQRVLMCASGNHALLVAILGLKLVGKAIVTEEFTYSAFKALAAMLGVTLLPCPADEDGMLPAALDQLCRRHAPGALMLQPTIHNPTCLTMPLQRRRQIAELAQAHALTIVEDDAYRFLHEDAPARFADLAPAHTLHIASLSKSFSPALKVCYLLAPAALQADLEQAIRLSSSGASGMLGRIASMMLADGALDELVRLKREQARSRQAQLAEGLAGLRWRTHPTAFHAWLQLPAGCQADRVRDAMLREGVDLSSGVEFAAPGVDGASAVRISLGAESEPARLQRGLRTLRAQLAVQPQFTVQP